MNNSSFFDKVIRIIESDIIEKSFDKNQFSVTVSSDNLIRVATILKNHSELKMNQLVDIIAVDYPSRVKRFEVIYNLLSYSNEARLFLKVHIKKDAKLHTLTNVFENASWYEREVFDLMGISFSSHPDLRRILTDYNFDGHPLRKDFPLSGYTQVYFDEKKQKVDYEPVKLQQTYRNFDTLSPWEGMLHKKHKT